MKGHIAFYIALLTVSLFAIVWAMVKMPSFETNFLPLVFSSMIFLLTGIGLWRDIWADAKPEANKTKESTVTGVGDGGIDEESWGRLMLQSAWIGGFLLAVYLIGMLVSIPLFVLFYMRFLSTQWNGAIMGAIFTSIVTYIVLHYILEIELYRGLLLSLLIQ